VIARIVACCDAFNAMTTDRSYRKAMPLDDAVAELWRSSGTQFDPRVVDALVAPLEDYETGSVVAPPKIELSTT
jgi:HD-GYP domain-containing protein (c-di-GMP phosphodiesterase class II)